MHSLLMCIYFTHQLFYILVHASHCLVLKLLSRAMKSTSISISGNWNSGQKCVAHQQLTLLTWQKHDPCSIFYSYPHWYGSNSNHSNYSSTPEASYPHRFYSLRHQCREERSQEMYTILYFPNAKSAYLLVI